MSSMLLSTGKKKQSASRVFGGDLFDPESSLCYTPSPMTKSSKAPFIGTSAPSPSILFKSIDEGRHLDQVAEETSMDKENECENFLQVAPKGSTQKKSNVRSFREAERARLRSAFMTPQRKDVMKRTQDAINTATTSVIASLSTKGKNATDFSSLNPSLISSQQAKANRAKRVARKTKKVRFQWKEETDEAKALSKRVEESRRMLLDTQRQLSSAHFKEKARKEDVIKWNQLAQLDRESRFNSSVFREHQQSLKAERDRERKMSIDAREKLRRNIREGEERMKLMRLDEDQAIVDVRHDLCRSRQEGARANAESRRNSFQFRAGDAKKIKERRAKWREDELQASHESFELKRAAAKDVELHKKKMNGERRDSFKSRNHHAKQQRDEESQRHAERRALEQESIQLTLAGARDVDRYRKEQAEERRQSIAGRNEEKVRHTQVMEELRGIANQKEAESFSLKWAGQKDATEYVSQLAAERRKSMQFRGSESRRIRAYEDEMHQNEVVSALREADLQSDCQKDVNNYKAEVAERGRKSLQFRAKQARVQRLEVDNRKHQDQVVEHQNFELDSLAHKDIEEYMKDCAAKRRQSLAFRAKEKRHHANWHRQQREQELREQSETSNLRSLDAHYMAIAAQEERARVALAALRSAGCTIKGNPFGDILGP